MSQNTRLKLSELVLAFISMLFTISAWGAIEKFASIDNKINANRMTLEKRIDENRAALHDGAEKYERLLAGQSAILTEIKNMKEYRNGDYGGKN